MDFLADKTGSVKKRKTQNKTKAADLEGCNRIEANEKHLLGVFFPLELDSFFVTVSCTAAVLRVLMRFPL